MCVLLLRSGKVTRQRAANKDCNKSLASNKSRHLGAALIRLAQGAEKEIQVLVQRIEERPDRIGIEPADSDIDEIRVQLAELVQVGGVWVHGVAVNSAIVPARLDRVLREDLPDPTPNIVQRPGDIGTEEIIGQTTVLEKPARDGHVESERVGFAPIDEEGEGENGLCVCGEVTRGYQAEVWVRGDGILDALEADLGGHGEVVGPSAELIAECGELLVQAR